MVTGTADPRRTVAVHGVRMDVAHLDEATRQVVDWARSTGELHTRVVHPLPADPVTTARGDEAFRRLLNRGDLNVADGMGVVWAMRALGASEQRTRVYGPDLMREVLTATPELRHGFVGGQDAVALEQLLDSLRDRHGIRTVVSHCPPHRQVSPDAVSEDVDALGVGTAPVDVLWVGLGTPKQQQWAELARDRRVARVIVTVGAAFDFHAGRVRQAPPWMQRAGLEWAFRLSQDPRRLWRRYLVGNVRHVIGVTWDLLARRRRPR